MHNAVGDEPFGMFDVETEYDAIVFRETVTFTITTFTLGSGSLCPRSPVLVDPRPTVSYCYFFSDSLKHPDHVAQSFMHFELELLSCTLGY